MLNTFITYLQIFGIGFSFGIIGPCFLVCTPVLITYIVGSKRGWTEVFKDILVFLSGRLIAYLLLGFLAGLSGAVLRKFTSSALSAYFQPLAGAISIFFAIIILTDKFSKSCHCEPRRGEACLAGRQAISFNFGGVLTFGFLIGMSPCAPLLALLFDITLMSKSAIDGMLYALSFGLGTFLSGLITVGMIAEILTWIPAALIKSKTADIIFRILCAALLAALGLTLIFKNYKI